MKHLPLTDKRIQQIKVIDNKEAIKSLDLNDSKLVLDYDMDLGYTNQFVARESVVQRLKLASNFLPNGFYLSVQSWRAAITPTHNHTAEKSNLAIFYRL